MSFPKKLDRVTKHKTPRYQLYQPGFNDANSCWLGGSWVTLPKDEWKQKKVAHKKLYGNLNKNANKQHHRNKGTRERPVLTLVDRAYLEDTVARICEKPMRRYFPEVKGLEDALALRGISSSQ